MRRAPQFEGLMRVLPKDGACQRLDEKMSSVCSQMEPVRVHMVISDESWTKVGFPGIGYIPCGFIVARDILLRMKVWRRFKQHNVIGRHVRCSVGDDFRLQFLRFVDGKSLSFVRLSGVICQSRDDDDVSWLECCLSDFVACMYELVCFVNEYVVLNVIV